MISHFYHNLYLIITRTQARMLPVAESKTLFPDSVTHHPKAVLAGGLPTHQEVRPGQVDSLKPQNLIEPLKNGITKDPEG